MKRSQNLDILYVEHIFHGKANYIVTIPIQGGQDQVSETKVPLLSHGEALKTQTFIND